MFCDEFFNEDAFYCKQFVIDQKRCFNCLSKKNHVKDYLRVYMSSEIMWYETLHTTP